VSRIFSVRINLDSFFASLGICDTDQERSVWLQGFQIGSLGGPRNPGWSIHKLAGYDVGRGAYLAAHVFSQKQSDKGKLSAASRSTTVEPRLNQASTTVEPSLNQASTISNNRVIEESKEQESVNHRGRFTPPSLDEVSAYCQERGNDVDPGKWTDHYQSKGWLVGKGKMKDWKAAVRTWEPDGFVPLEKRPQAKRTTRAEAAKAFMLDINDPTIAHLPE
jgi:hypothetical protein